MNEHEISKIKVNGNTYDVKDEELRQMIEILLGNAPVNSEKESESDTDEVAQNRC